jgi:hypothetical protein
MTGWLLFFVSENELFRKHLDQESRKDINPNNKNGRNC